MGKQKEEEENPMYGMYGCYPPQMMPSMLPMPGQMDPRLEKQLRHFLKANKIERLKKQATEKKKHSTKRRVFTGLEITGLIMILSIPVGFLQKYLFALLQLQLEHLISSVPH